jgi:hypothetical protein
MSYSYQIGNDFWCQQEPGPNGQPTIYTKNRIRCGDVITVNCQGGSPGGGGLQGDCSLIVINNGLLLCDGDDSWNCHLCANDLPYFNPLRNTDPLMFQFQQFDYINGQSPIFNWSLAAGWGTMVTGTIYDCCTDDVIVQDVLNVSTKDFVGIYATKNYNGTLNWKNIQMIEFDVAAIENQGIGTIPNWDGCFYFKFFFFDSNANVVREITSEPFKFEKCDPDNTIFLEGVYNKSDCFQYFYKPDFPSIQVQQGPILNTISPYIGIGTPFQYRNTYRVKGSFELSGFEINKEFVGIRQFTANTETAENWLFRTNRLPARVARLIRNILAADTVYVESIDYIASGTITKNNEIGNQWFLESQLKRVQCSSTNSCN